MWDKELELSKIAAIKAGRAIMEVYNAVSDIEIEYKDGDMPLTVADRKANAIIVELLKKNFPTYSILSEEEKDSAVRLTNDFCFIVDPLDGTKEFIKKNGQFTVNIALSFQHKAIMGVIYVPVTKELYYASQGKGAYRQKVNGMIEKLHVSDNVDIESLRVVISGSHDCVKMEEILKKYDITNFIRMGSSLKGCMIASGAADVYYRYNPTMEWDTAAMQCIVEEAGGVFRQMDGSEMIYNRKDSVNKKGFYVINQQKNLLV